MPKPQIKEGQFIPRINAGGFPGRGSVIMNISTGGPHILLFERDQQLAAILTSELQLTGYECRTARTAVEVFDTIARHSVRLVLVNLAQAAAARREFWVALDTQRRGSGIHVFTFHCSNLAGYGPRDPDDYTQASMADMEIDGMLGLMKLVDAISARVPSADAISSTMPRIPRSPIPSSPSAGQEAAHQLIQQPVQSELLPLTSNNIPGNVASYHYMQAADSTPTPVRPRMAATGLPEPPMNTTSTSAPPTQTPPPTHLTSSSVTELSGGNQTTYSDKIRAVLYPNQRSWGSPGNNNAPTWQDPHVEQDAARTYIPQVLSSPLPPTAPSEISVLQRLANGQTDMDGSGESGLAQLSRLVQGYQPSAREETSSFAHQSSRTTEFRNPSTNTSTQAVDQTDSNMPTYVPLTTRPLQPNEHPRTMNAAPSLTAQTEMTLRGKDYQARPVQAETTISSPRDRDYQLRAAPIQDLPFERSASSQVGYEGTKRLDVASSQAPRSIQQPLASQPPQPSLATQPPLASITTVAKMSTSTLSSPAINTTLSTPDRVVEPVTQLNAEPISNREKTEKPSQSEHLEKPANLQTKPRKETDESASAKNAVILDILQSLPAVSGSPLQQQQAVQPQVHNGRATRSLGSVLLDGHLVPQDRLEVAQNIQRMLRGVDLNYQLGEILLMFKLLTPDQLLAASLVSYGLITTTQISALGRIRQELYAIGLEYDLENLLILFRILTPEQLREARSNAQN